MNPILSKTYTRFVYFYEKFRLDLLTRRKGQSMTEEGTLSIVRHEKAYKEARQNSLTISQLNLL
jgi:hypothetical protein